MIDSLRNRHPDSVIAVVGSGPTAVGYTGREDVAIALNGAILLDQHFDYMFGFDRRLPSRDYWLSKQEIPRILGANIVGFYPPAYEIFHEAKTEVDCLHSEFLESHPPTPPHSFFYYQRVTSPVIGAHNHLHHNGNVAHPGLELAAIMGACRVVLYGVSLRERSYFYTGNKREGGSYGEGARAYLEQEIALLQQRGLTIEWKDL